MEKVEKLYKNLSSEGFELGTLDEFNASLQDPDKRGKFYYNLSKEGYNLGTLDEFSAMVSPQKKNGTPSELSSPTSGVDSKTASPVTLQTETVDLKDIPVGDPPAQGIDITMPQSEVGANTQTNGLGQSTMTQKVSEPGTVDTKAIIGKQSEEVRAANILETSKALDMLAVYHKMDPTPWKREIESILTNNNRPQEVNDVLALRAAYSKFKDLGVTRHTDLPGIGVVPSAVVVTSAVNAIGSGNGGEEMAKTWDLLSQAEQQLRNDNPNEWNKLIQSDREKHYGKLYAQDPKYTTKGDALLPGISVGEKQLIAGAIDNGWTGLSSESDLVGANQDEIDAERARMNSEIGSGPLQELVLAHQTGGMKSNTSEVAEAKLRNELAHGQQKLAALKESGASPEMLAEANKAYSSIKKQADDMRATRHEELLQQIDQAKAALDRTDLPKMARAAGMELLKSLEEKEKGFIDPTYEFDKVMSENVEGIAEASEPTDTPLQAMRKYLANMIYEKKMLDERIGGGEGLFEGIKREATGLTVRGWNDDEKRSKELQQKIAAVSRVVLLNELPEHSTSAGSAFKGSFANTLYGASSMGKLFDTDTQQGQMIAVDEMLQAAGIDKEAAINPVYKKRFEEGKENPAWVSWEHLGSLGGMMTGMGMQSVAGGAVLEGVGAGKVLAKLAAQVNAGTKGARFAKAALTAIKKGAEYEITGDIFKDQEHFFNFTTGFAGGAAEGVLGGIGRLGKDALGKARQGMAVTGGLAAVYGKGTAKKMGQIVSNAFGNKSTEAANWIMANGKSIQENLKNGFAQRVGHGIGAGVGQFAEGNIRTLQDIGGEGNVFGTIDGLVKIFEDSDVRAKYHEELNKQFGSTLSEKVGFFADMFFIGMMTGGGNKGIGNEARVRLRELYSEMTTEQRSLADELVNSAGELDQMHDSVLDRQRAEEAAPTLGKDIVAQPPKEFVERPMEKVQDAIDESVQKQEQRIKELGENPSKRDIRKIGKEAYAEREKLRKENPQYEKFREEHDAAFDEYRKKREAIDPEWKDETNPEVAALRDEYRAKEKAIADKYSIKDTVLESAREDTRLRSELEIEGKDLKAEADPMNKVPEVEEVSPEAEPVVVEPTEPASPEMKATLDETVADIEQRRQDAIDALGNDGVTIQQTKAIREKYDAEIQAAKDHFGKPVEPTVTTGPETPPTPPVTNEAAGGGTPPLPPPIEVSVPEITQQGGGTQPPTEPVTSTTTGGGPLRRRATMETWAREDNKLSKSLTKVLEAAQSYYQRQKHSELYTRAMNLLTGGKETVKDGVSTWEWENGKGSPLEMIDQVAEGKVRDVSEFADVLAQRQVLMKLVTDSMDSIVKELKTETDPQKVKDLENVLNQFDMASNKLAKALNEQGTIGGQGISFLGHFRNMYENPEGMIWNEVAKFNKKRAEEVKNKTKEIADEINSSREQIVEQTGDAVANSPTVTEASEKAVKSSTKSSSKDSIAKQRAKRQESVSKLKDLLKAPDKGRALDVTTIAAELIGRGGEALLELGKIGVSLTAEGAIRFTDWAKKMRDELKGVVDFTDEDLRKVFNMKVDGTSPKEIAQIELRRAAIAPEKKGAREQTLRQKIQGEFQKGADNIEARLMDKAGLTAEEAKFVKDQGKEVIEKSTKKLDDQRVAKEEKEIKKEQDRIQKEADKQVAKAEAVRKKEFGQKVNTAITDFYRDPTGKPIEERLADNGLNPTEIQELMDARSSEFTQGAVEAITKAAKEPLPKTKSGEPTIRQKIQTAFNDHFNPKNSGSGITLKERLTKDVGLSETQADLVLSEEKQQLSKREQALVDEVLRREAETIQKAAEAAEKQEQQQIKNNVREAINEHFGRDTIKNKVEDKLANEAGLPDKSTDKLQVKAGATKPAPGSKITENGLDYEYVGESADGNTLNYERIKTPEEIAKREEIAKIAKKAATFGKMKLLDGKNVTKEMLAQKIGESTGLEGKELSDLVDFVHDEANKSFVDRIEEKTGLPRADAERIAQDANKDFEERAKRHVESKVKALGKKPKAEKVHRATTDVDRAMNALMDGELTDEMVNEIFKDRLGFMEQMTPEQASRMRDLAKALAKTDPGSILELDAARKMDRAFGHFLPSDSGWSKAGETFKAWAYANMLNGITTSAVNIISAAPYIALAPALNMLNMSEWVFALRNAIQAEGGAGTKANVFARSSPVAGAVVKYAAGAKAGKQAFRRASDIFLQGYIDNKFLSAGQQAFGKQMNILERTAYNRLRLSSLKALGMKDLKVGSNYVDAYSWLLKFSGRNLAAQDVFLRTVAHEMQLADAVRKADAFITRGDMAKMGFTKEDMAAAGYSAPSMRNLTYTQWVNFEMSMNNPRFKNVKEMAIQDVKVHEELTGGLTDTQRKRYVNARAKEIMRFGGTNEETGEKILGLRLSEKEKEDAESVARSQIFTHLRGGVHSKWSGQLAKWTGKGAGKILWPLIPFTTIIGNLSDTMADFNPLTGVARANGISTSELLAQFQRSNNAKNGVEKPVLSAKMGDRSPYGTFTGDRIKSAIMNNKDAKYYEQMARYWTGVQGFVALSMMVNQNPYSQGLGLTGSQDDKPYMITWNGEAKWSYKDLPFIAPAATLVAQFNQWNREYPDKKDQAWYEESGARLWYALGEAEMISSKVSVAEGSMRAMDLVQGVFELGEEKRPWQDTPDLGEKVSKLFGKVSKPYVSVLTKPIPWRASLLEQIGQAFDPAVYSKSDIVNSLTYAFTGAAYKLPGIDKIEMVDIYGDPIKKFPGEDRMGFLSSFRDDISLRPHVKFMNERGIVLAPTQNRAIAWEDQKDILGVSYKDYTTEQFAYFVKTAGQNFKTMLTGGTIKVGDSDIELPGIMNMDPEVLKQMDNTVVSSGEKRMTATEKAVRKALSDSRTLARNAVKAKFATPSSSPMSEGGPSGGVNW